MVNNELERTWKGSVAAVCQEGVSVVRLITKADAVAGI